MHFFLVISLLATSFIITPAASDEMQELLAMLRKNCMSETGVDESLIINMNKGDFADDKNLKCYVKCVMGQIGALDDAGIVDPEGVLAAIPPEQMTALKQNVIRKCGTQAGSDACETAWLTQKCYSVGVGAEYFFP